MPKTAQATAHAPISAIIQPFSMMRSDCSASAGHGVEHVLVLAVLIEPAYVETVRELKA